MRMIGVGWVVGLIVLFADMLIFMALWSVMARVPMFEAEATRPLLWWPDIRALSAATVVGVVPAVWAGIAAARRDASLKPMVFGLFGVAAIWLVSSPFLFGAGMALMPTGNVVVRGGTLSPSRTEWPAAMVQVSLGCRDQSSVRRKRLLREEPARFQPEYDLVLPTGRRLNLDAFKSGIVVDDVDRWIAVLVIADGALMRGGARKMLKANLDEGCVRGLLAQSRERQSLVRLYSLPLAGSV